MQFDIFNRYTKVSDATEEEIQLLKEWCTKDYKYYGLDFSRRPVRRREKIAYLSYFEGSKFPTGWVGTFIRRLKTSGYQVKCNDNRIKPLKIRNMNIEHNIPPLRDYQQTAHDLALLNTRGIIHHATGAGKTIIMAKLLETLELQSIIIVPTLNLLMQISDEFKKFFGENHVGIIGEGTYDPKLFTVATIQSLWSLIKQNDFNLKMVTTNIHVLMIDEAHHINIAGKNKLQNTYFKIAQLLDAYYRYGFTATPGESDSLDRELLEAATGGIIHTISSSHLIRIGLLSRPIIDIYEVICKRYSDWPQAYKENILRNVKRNNIIRRLAEQYAAENQSILITVNRVDDHGVVLNKMIKESVLMIGSTPTSERKKILKDFANKDIKILISTVINEGVDIPSMNIIIMGGGGKSSRATIQRVGRALRRAEGKTEARIIDFYDNDRGMLLKHSRARMRVYRSEEEFELRKTIKEDTNNWVKDYAAAKGR